MTGQPPTYASNVLGSQIYYRWWMRIDPGFDWGDGATWGGPAVARTKSGRQNEPGTDPASQWYTGTVRASGFYLAECMASSGHSGACLNNNGTTGSDQGPMGVSYDMTAHDDGQWHEYIVRIKYNTSASCTTPGTCDAEIEVYVDGTSVGSYTGFRLTNRDGQAYEHWGSWMTNPYFQGGSSYSAGGTIYLDDFSTDDTWNSTAGGSDTTAPTAPTSLSCPSSVTTSITCTWTASTDAVGVTGYKVERRSLPDGGAWTQAGLPSGTSYADTVPETTRYEYRVSAADAAGNWSATSTTTTATSHINVAFDYGVNLPLEFRNGTWNSTQRGLALDAVVAMCGSDCWVRMDITHSSVCPTTTGTPIYGTCDWSAYNTYVSEVQARGLKLLAMVGYSPAWNRDGACSTSNALPIDGSAFGAFAGQVASRYHPDAIELWNEPNAIGFSCPLVSASNFAAKVQIPGYNAIKAIDPTIPVIAGGTTPATDVGCSGSPVSCTSSRTAMGWYVDFYAAGAKQYWDAIAHHPYTDSANPPGTTYTSGLGTGWMQMEQYTGTSLRTAMNNNGQSSLHIWTTEWGIPTSGTGGIGSVSEATQASSWVTPGFTILAGKSWTGPSFWYVLSDRCATTSDKECWFGLIRADNSHKPAFTAFQALAGTDTTPPTAPTGLGVQ
ncbi:MAG: hypothetical protein WBP40_03510 [Candidatus Moraniibacteriota bacterium]